MDQALIELGEKIQRLTDENEKLDFPSFNHADAYALGTDIVRRATERSFPIAVAIRFGEQLVFYTALAGTCADNDLWLARKARIVSRYNAASLLVAARLDAIAKTLPGWDLRCDLPSFDATVLPASGGGVPLRVRGSLIGSVAVSGLTDDQDHDLVVDALADAVAARNEG